MGAKPAPKRIAQPEFALFSIATGALFAGAFVFFAALFYADYNNRETPRKFRVEIVEDSAAPQVFNPAIFAMPPLRRNEMPIGMNLEFAELRNAGNTEFANPEIRNFTIESFTRVKMPPPPFGKKPVVRKRENEPEKTPVKTDVVFGSDGFAAEVYVVPGQVPAEETVRDAVNKASRLRGEPGTVSRVEL